MKVVYMIGYRQNKSTCVVSRDTILLDTGTDVYVQKMFCSATYGSIDRPYMPLNLSVY